MFQERFTVIGRVEAVLVGNQPVRSTVQDEKIELYPDGVTGDRHTRQFRQLGVRDKALMAIGLPKGLLLAPTRQVSVVSLEELQEIKEALHIPKPIPFGSLGENLVLSGIPRLTQLPPGTLLCFRKGNDYRTAVVAVWAENTPCIIAGQALQENTFTVDVKENFATVAAGKRGIVGFVMSSGTIKKNDIVEAHIPAQRIYAL